VLEITQAYRDLTGFYKRQAMLLQLPFCLQAASSFPLRDLVHRAARQSRRSPKGKTEATEN
jgi:hypothetical protein